MKRVLEIGRRLLREEDGATTTEYGLLVGLVAVALVAVLARFRDAIIGVFDAAKSELNAAAGKK
jgi:pilus assembly protein Flp/PilA